MGKPFSYKYLTAPIIIFCYNRFSHLQKTVDALKANALVKESDLYIFSDGPKSEPDQIEVKRVRDFIQTITGFKSINISLSENNQGLAQSVIDGVSRVIKEHGRAIVLEDDILVSSDFLNFMNQALEKYENHQKIYSVSGYSYKLEQIKQPNELFMVKRASSWGWGTWENRWASADWDVTDYMPFLSSPKLRSAFQNAGKDQLVMLVKQMQGIIDSWAVRWTYHHFKKDAYCLVPKFSKVKNIGTDGTGTNFTNSVAIYDTELHSERVTFPEEIKELVEVTYFIRNHYSPSLMRRCINYIHYRVW
ncbi:MAG: GR25 family glycosyltransferase involved in LPS biosynthesis [Psychromonas sp.]